MKPIPAMRVVTATNARALGRPPFGSFTSVSTDTRNLEAGALFVALRGEKFDGHAYLQQAADHGAMAAIVDEQGFAGDTSVLPVYVVPDTTKALGDLAAAYRRQFDIPVIGITGSVGKTTTKDFAAAVLGSLGEVVATEENHNNEIGVPQTLFRMDDDTAAAVVEMGMRGAGQIAELARIAQPTGGLITAIGKTHAEFFDNGITGVALAKAELLDGMAAGRPVALPADSDWWRSLLQEHARGPITTFGFEDAADVRAEHYRLVEGRAHFRIVTPDGAQDVSLSAPGRHLAANAAGAVAIGLWCGVPLEAAVRALERVELGQRRLNVKQAAGGWTVIDDTYNAGPESMRAALDVLRSWPAARRIAVFGDMRELGSDAEAEHTALGREAAQGLALLVTVGDLGRLIGEAARKAGSEDVRHAGSVEEAVSLLRSEVQAGDVVLVKGSRALGLEGVVDGVGG